MDTQPEGRQRKQRCPLDACHQRRKFTLKINVLTHVPQAWAEARGWPPEGRIGRQSDTCTELPASPQTQLHQPHSGWGSGLAPQCRREARSGKERSPAVPAGSPASHRPDAGRTAAFLPPDDRKSRKHSQTSLKQRSRGPTR